MARKAIVYRNPNTESLSEGVARSIREAIILGRFKPGAKIVENQLAKRIGISRSPVREAFRILEQEGLVTLTPRKGAKVTQISLKEAKETYAIRANLESLAAKLAVSNLKDGKIKRMENLLEKMSFKTKKNDINGILKLNEKFHDILLKSNDNIKLDHLIHSLRVQIQRFRVASLSLPGRLKEVLSEHRKIVEACKQRDASLIEEYVKEHITQAGNKLLKNLERGNINGQS